MTLTRKRTSLNNSESVEQYFQGAMIDENGREIPITRDMITEACESLEARRIRHSFCQKGTDTESKQRFS